MTTGVRAIIVRDEKIVMVSHHEIDHGEVLLFPGGGIEDGESISQAAEREVLEETGLTVAARSIAYLREVSYKGGFGVEFYVLCDYISGELELGYDPEHLPNKQILSGVTEIPLVELDAHSFKPSELDSVLIKNAIDGSTQGINYLGLSYLDSI